MTTPSPSPAKLVAVVAAAILASAFIGSAAFADHVPSLHGRDALIAPAANAGGGTNAAVWRQLNSYLAGHAPAVLTMHVTGAAFGGGTIVNVSGQPQVRGESLTVETNLGWSPAARAAGLAICRAYVSAVSALHITRISYLQINGTDERNYELARSIGGRPGCAA